MGRDEKRDGSDDTLARTDTGEVAIDFLPRRSHQLIATPITPRLPPRSVVPACRFAWALCSISPLDLSCLGSFLFYRFVPARLVLSLSRLALLPFLSLSRLAPSMAAKGAGNGDAGGAFLYAPFSSARCHLPRHQALLVGSSDRFRSPPWRSRRGFLIISSVRLVLLVPIVLSHHGAEALVSVIFQASNDGMAAIPSVHHLIPSSHPIPVMERLVRRLVSCVSLGVSSPYTGSSTKDVMKTKASKRTRKNGEGTGTRNRGVGRDEGRNENGNTTGTGRWQHKNGKQASKQARATETYDAIMGKNKTPLILFRPTPSPWVLIGSPASISPPPPGRGMRG